MKSLISIFIVFASISIASGQTGTFSMTNNLFTGKLKYFEGGNSVSKAYIEQKISTNPLSSKLYKEGNNFKKGSNVLSFSGGFIIGLYLGTVAVTDARPDVILLAGVGLIVLSVPLHAQSTKRLNIALDVLNSELEDKQVGQSSNQIELSLGMGQNGIGLRLQF